MKRRGFIGSVIAGVVGLFTRTEWCRGNTLGVGRGLANDARESEVRPLPCPPPLYSSLFEQIRHDMMLAGMHVDGTIKGGLSLSEELYDSLLADIEAFRRREGEPIEEERPAEVTLYTGWGKVVARGNSESCVYFADKPFTSGYWLEVGLEVQVRKGERPYAVFTPEWGVLYRSSGGKTLRGPTKYLA